MEATRYYWSSPSYRKDQHIEEVYRITGPNPPSPLASNAHLATFIIYKTVGEDISFTQELELDSRVGGRDKIKGHLGVTVIEMMVDNEPFPSAFIVLVSVCLPNRDETNTLG